MVPGKSRPRLVCTDERAAEGIQAEKGIGARNEVHIGNGRLGNEVPGDRIPKPVVEAHAVQVYREANRAASQGRGQKAPVGDVVLPGIVLAGGEVDGPETTVEAVREIEQVLGRKVVGRERLHIPRVFLHRDAESRERGGPNDCDRRQSDAPRRLRLGSGGQFLCRHGRAGD